MHTGSQNSLESMFLIPTLALSFGGHGEFSLKLVTTYQSKIIMKLRHSPNFMQVACIKMNKNKIELQSKVVNVMSFKAMKFKFVLIKT